MENKIVPFDESFIAYSRRVGTDRASKATPFQVVKGAEITALFDRGDRQNEALDKKVLSFPNRMPHLIPDIIA